MTIGRPPQQGQGIGQPDFVWLNGLAGGNNRYCQSVTALAGGGNPGATLIGAPNAQGIEAALVEIRTVASAGDSCQLPQAINGKTLMVYNSSANSANVFPNQNVNKATGVLDTLNGGAGAIAVPAVGTAGYATIYFCPRDGIWAANRGAI